jgi:signal transduction histidine kinase
MGLATVFIRDISDQKRSEETLRNSSAQLREFAARLEAVREEERTRVARELHDELGQVLTILKLDLSWVHGKIRSHRELRKKTSAMIDYVDATIERVRQISSELRPSILDDLGLSAAIEWQGAEFQKRTGIRIRVQSDADHVILPKDCQAATFRVVQEALTNVIRHAEARTVQVTLKSVKNELKISVADDGKGMTQERLRDTKSLGIVGMKERIARLGGEFGIFSEPGKGTRLDIIIPAHND